ncbi:MAG: ankyrin repeat domain-containing protein [Bdellovibrionales bacterium]|nr:ankyrin repeat domain-containing protein [Bdellovibrionales bacterium]
MRLFVLSMLSVLFFFGCAPKSQPPSANDAPRPETFVSHTIQYPGETLGLIARWYTGNSSNWEEIEAANPFIQVKNLQLGETIRIPDRLITRRDPLTEDFLKEQGQKQNEQVQVAQTEEPFVPDASQEPAGEQREIIGEINGEPLFAREPKEETPNDKLIKASMFGDAGQVKAAIEAGADPNTKENNRPVISWAAQAGNLEVVQALLSGGADKDLVDGIGHTALLRAADMGSVPVVKALAQAGANVNHKAPNGTTAVLMAVQNGNKELLEALLTAGADPNIADSNGDTPTLMAVQNDQPELLAVLATAKADLNPSSSYYTPLSYAISQENASMVKAVLEAGADPNAKPQSGGAPIFQALNSPEILDLLLAAKANPNVTNDYGQTALMVAVENDSVETTEKLLKAGADMNAKDQSGGTALTLAQNRSNSEIADLLKRSGATE